MSHPAAARALETLNHITLCGTPVRLMPSQRDPSARRSGVGNVFVKVRHDEFLGFLMDIVLFIQSQIHGRCVHDIMRIQWLLKP